MKFAMPSPAQVQLAPRPGTVRKLFRLIGLSIAVGVPTAFWTLALMLMTKGAGVSLEPPALVSFSSAVAAWCLVVAILVTARKARHPGVLVSSAVPR